MARKKLTPTTEPAAAEQIAPATANAIVEAQDNAVTPTQADDILAAGVDIGRIEALDFIATIANSTILPIYENIKKSKAWRFIRNPESSNGSNFQSLDEFCQVKLGKTYGRMQHLLANRNLIGQEAFEQAERIGLRQVDYNAIKALPEPKQEMIKNALCEEATKDDIQRTLRELAAADQKEIETLTTRAETAEKQAEANDKVIEAKQDEITKLQKQLVTLQCAPFTDWPEAFQGYIQQAQKAGREIANALDSLAQIHEHSLKIEAQSPDEQDALERAWVALAQEMQLIYDRAVSKSETERHAFDRMLGAVAEDAQDKSGK